MTGSLFLSGGGGAEDSLRLDTAFASAVGSGPLWYWPVAMVPAESDYAACLEWVTGVFSPLGLNDIQMWDGAGDEPARRLPEFRGVYIGGGNTFRLLAVLRRNGLLTALKRFLENGGAVYGGSAGAAVMGVDITTVAHLDVDSCHTTDTRGLDLLAGHGVFVHHRLQDTPRAREWARENRRPVVALHERAGAVVADGQFTAVGFEPVHLVGDQVRSLQPGESVMLPLTTPDTQPR
ncbi:type 1 glutamine amidotransferase-like domain-containing protein [Streptacidiphilus sp. PB12-B1b]|uniref:Type 1 glutamine amidotransferase-like domain-containing protein n=1 Tax=Streptacidiphilus sp. PB12-B1b TaxID=2705012 RepID=UPI0015FA51C9|nr:Type 1 glutamine amidotransferase-like domain-containing protein [Streptacidiphilus sp. PB12-B1b]QMU77346.1 type 1 glutamine amidotransferase-like domain-containing protein [Streptacidiphilus sp. PB12-B1b]